MFATRPAPPAIPRRLELLGVLHRLCAPLSFLHGEGFVHGDLKPENVFLRSDGEPVLADFGLAWRFAAVEGRESLEPAGDPAGSIPYMAPELPRGRDVDARADLYALGCMLYEVVTGAPPFTSAWAGEVVAAHLGVPPEPPSRRAPDVPAALDDLVLGLLEKQPQDRIGYAADVAAALARHLAEAGHAPPHRETPAALPYLYRPGFAGREELLERIESRLVDAGKGRGSLLLLSAESGAGKTRAAIAATAIAAQLRQGVLAGGSAPGSASRAPLEALRRPLLAIADLCRSTDDEDGVAALDARLLGLYEPAFLTLRAAAGAPEIPPLPPAAARERLHGALLRALRLATRRGVRLLIVDDLQWADELTIGFLASLPEHLPVLPLVVLGACRSEEAGADLAKLRGRADAVERLPPLDGAAVAGMAADMLALREVAPELASLLARRSAGNPFFVAEYLRAAVMEGHLSRREGGRFTAAGDLQDIPLPDTVRELVQRRLAGLTDGSRRLAETAAVLGREMEPAVLVALHAAVSGGGDEDLSVLLARQVMEIDHQGRLRFVHDQLQEAAYGALSARDRRHHHREAARVLQEVGAGDALLAHHWEAAGAPAKARAFYLRAARAAREHQALVESERLYARYLALSRRPDADRIAAENELAEHVLTALGKIEEALAHNTQARQLAVRIGARDLELASLLGIASRHFLAGRPGDARTTAEEAKQLGSTGPYGGIVARAENLLGVIAQRQARAAEARQHFEAATRLAQEVSDLPSEAVAMANLASLLKDTGQTTDARTLYAVALGRLRAAGDRRGEGIILGNLALLATELGSFPEAEDLYRQALEIHRAAGNGRSEAYALGNLGSLAWERGRAVEARELFARALQKAAELGDRVMAGVWRVHLAQVEAETGSAEEALALCDVARDAIQGARDARNEGMLLAVRGEALRRLGKPDEAAAEIDAALGLLARAGDAAEQVRALCYRARTAQDAGERADEHVAEAARRVTGPVAARGSLGRLLASLGVSSGYGNASGAG